MTEFEFVWNGTIEKIQEMKDGRTVRIKGIAAHGGETSRNGRHYMREALLRAVNTFIGVPLTVNHNDKEIIGNVEEMDYDEGTDTLRYVADVKKEPYVTLIKQRSTEVKGVSIQADYQRDRCPKCKKEGFLDQLAFEAHMAKEHLIRNIKAGPWGIIGRALSLVFGNEIPGLNTTVNIAETAPKGFDSLIETVERFEMSKEKMNKFPEVKEKHETPTAPETKVATEQKIEPAKATQKIAEPCSPELKACVDALIAQGKPEESAWAICRSKIGETVVLKESKIAPIVWNPINFESFDIIVKEMKDELRAGQTCKQNREINEAFKNVVATLNEIVVEANKPTTIRFPPAPEDDVSWKLNLKELKESLAILETKLTQELKRIIEAIPKDDLTWKEILAKLPSDDLTWKETLAKLQPDDLGWKDKFKEYDTIKTAVIKADENVLEIKKGFDEKMRMLEQENVDLKKKQEEKSEKQTKETVETNTRLDNLEDKLKPKFKGSEKQKGADW